MDWDTFLHLRMESVVFSLDVGNSVCLVISCDLVATGHEFDYFGGESVILGVNDFFFFSEALSADVMLFWRVTVTLCTSIVAARVGVVSVVLGYSYTFIIVSSCLYSVSFASVRSSVI